jgi:archaellum component FlaF (FlaF/FlaG flagellin family)
MRRSKAGAMEALTVIVLAVAAIVLAAVVWIFLLGSTQTQTAALDFVFDASLISMNSGSCRLSLTVKNTGSVPLDRFNVYIGGTLVSIPPIATPSNPLPPGRSASSAGPVVGPVACPLPGSSVVVEVVGGSGQNEIRKVARVVVQ